MTIVYSQCVVPNELFVSSAKSPIMSKRILNIVEYLTMAIFQYSCRGFYEEHKFLFTLLLALKIDLENGHVKHQEFMTLIKGQTCFDFQVHVCGVVLLF